MTQFTDLGLAEPILRALKSEGYETPTPIQAKLIPVMLKGRDIVGIAQTGTGKTAAFVLPLLNEIGASTTRPEPRSCKALIVTPTRELAAQIADNITAYAKYMKVTSTVIVGGVKPNPQIRAMARGVDILVATPGRLLDHIGSGAIRLDKTTRIILDEADQMLDLGFMPAIRRIMSLVPRARQTALLSATMPKQIRSLANDFLNDPAEISVTPASKPVERIEQSVIFVPKHAKPNLLTDILKKTAFERVIVFTRTKHGADKVARALTRNDLPSEAIHGNKSQNQRQRALDNFKKGDTMILVATDIAARGIDVDGISHVINYDLPNVPESYIHRIGRTARAGADGIAIAFCDREERPLLKDIEKLMNISIQKEDAGPEYANIAKEKDDLVRSQPNGQRGRSGGRSNTAGSAGGSGRGRSGGSGGYRSAKQSDQYKQTRRADDAGASTSRDGSWTPDASRRSHASAQPEHAVSGNDSARNQSNKPKRLKPRHTGPGGQRSQNGGGGGRGRRQG